MTDQPDFRALCAGLVPWLGFVEGLHEDRLDSEEIKQLRELADRARAALSTPPLAPIPVSERLPEPEDCGPSESGDSIDAWVWVTDANELGKSWHQCHARSIPFVEWITHWLPHWAIPLPEESK